MPVRSTALLVFILCNLDSVGLLRAADPRTEITIVPYRAAEARTFEEFEALIMDSLQNKGFQLYGELQDKIAPEYIQHLLGLKNVSPFDDISTPADAIKYYQNRAPLVIMDGSVAESDRRRQFRSNIYVGPPLENFREQRFSVVYVHDVDNIAQPENALIFYFMYALAKDAARANLPKEVTLVILKEASFAVQSLSEPDRQKYEPVIEEISRSLQ